MKRVLLISIAGLLMASNAMAGMENCRFALHWKTEFVGTKAIATLCDDAGTMAVEPNYSPNWNSTTTTPNPLPCTQYTTAGPLGSNLIGATVYLVVGRVGTEGLSAVSFGINYHGGTLLPSGTGIDPNFVTFLLCANGLIFSNDGGNGEFPKPKGGTRITWNLPGACQLQEIAPAGIHAVVGSFYCYAYSTDRLAVTPNNNLQSGIPELSVADCNGVETSLTTIWPTAIVDQIMGKVDFGGGSGYNPCLITPSALTTWGKIKSKYNN